MNIGVDLMGSESSPETLFEAVLDSASRLDFPVNFTVFVTKEASVPLFRKYTDEFRSSNINTCLADESIAMEDDPLAAIRLKKNSTLILGIQQLKDKKLDAFVSAGNTGALIASASISLSLIPGCDRAALLAILPSKETPLAIIDVGGNVSCKASQLVQQAHLGAAYQRASMGMDKPKVGLLNIGVESKKGTSEVKEAYRILTDQALLPDAKFRFLGNIEGREAFQGTVDVLVTDGFTGNILLKTSEGISSFVFDYLAKTLDKNLLGEAQKHFSYEQYPGALLCGVDGIVLKCHGAASTEAMNQSILGAANLVHNRLLEKIKEEFS